MIQAFVIVQSRALKKMATQKAIKIAKLIPLAVLSKTPVRIPIHPSFCAALSEAWVSECPNERIGIVAPIPQTLIRKS